MVKKMILNACTKFDTMISEKTCRYFCQNKNCKQWNELTTEEKLKIKNEYEEGIDEYIEYLKSTEEGIKWDGLAIDFTNMEESLKSYINVPVYSEQQNEYGDYDIIGYRKEDVR